MFTLVPTILAASLLGSAHCAGMCGGFVAFYAGSDHADGWRKSLTHFAYHGGRGAIYVVLGALAGSLGHAVDRAGHLAGIQQVAAMVAGAAMAIWGLVALARALGAHLPAVPLPRPLVALYGRVMRALAGKPPMLRAGLLGLASALLPCGWLYAFVMTAAGTGSAVWGASAMFAFWLGTLPLLVGLGVGVQHLAGPLRRHLPKLTAVVLVVVGLMAVTQRARLPVVPGHAGAAVLAPVGAAEQLQRIEQGHAGKCCHDPGE